MQCAYLIKYLPHTKRPINFLNITPWSRVLLEKVISHSAKKFHLKYQLSLCVLWEHVVSLSDLQQALAFMRCVCNVFFQCHRNAFRAISSISKTSCSSTTQFFCIVQSHHINTLFSNLIYYIQLIVIFTF